MNSIWIPYIIFRNTDNDDAVDIQSSRAVVSINRQGNFVRSGPEIAEEVIVLSTCNSIQNILFVRLRYSKEKKI